MYSREKVFKIVVVSIIALLAALPSTLISTLIGAVLGIIAACLLALACDSALLLAIHLSDDVLVLVELRQFRRAFCNARVLRCKEA